MWKFESSVGTFVIKFHSKSGKYALILDDQIYGMASDPVALASNVYCHVTGCFEWDILDGQYPEGDAPTDLYGWEKY